MDSISKGSASGKIRSDAARTIGILSGQQMDVMDVTLLKEDVALIWAYWGVIHGGKEYEKIARLCPYFVDGFLEVIDAYSSGQCRTCEKTAYSIRKNVLDSLEGKVVPLSQLSSTPPIITAVSVRVTTPAFKH